MPSERCAGQIRTKRRICLLQSGKYRVPAMIVQPVWLLTTGNEERSLARFSIVRTKLSPYSLNSQEVLRIRLSELADSASSSPAALDFPYMLRGLVKSLTK